MNLKRLSLSLLFGASLPVMAFNDEFEKAISSFDADNIEAAYIHVRNVLKAEPSRLPAKLLYADILLKKGMYTEAEDQLLGARALGADVDLLVEPFGKVLMRLGQYQRIFSEFESAKLSLPSQRNLALLKASAYLGLKQEQQALDIYLSLAASAPDDQEVQLGLASVYVALFELEEAQTIIDSLLSVDAKNASAVRYQATLHYLRGHYAEAQSAFKQALELENDNVLTLRGLVNVHIALEQFEPAQIYVERLIELEPYDPQAQLLNSIVLTGLNQNEQANRLLKLITDELSALDQTFILSKPQLMLIDAMASYSLRNWEQSLVKFNRYVNNAGEHLDVRAVVLLADVYQQLGNPSDALRTLETHAERLLQNKDFALLLVSMYVRYNQRIDAEQLLNRLQRLYQNDQDILIYSAHILSQKQKVSEALNLLETAQDKTSAHYRHTLAVLYLKAGQAGKSVELMSELSTAHPENLTYQLLLIDSLKIQGQLKPAFDRISRLYQAQPENAKVKAEYAKFVYAKGDKQQAYDLFFQLAQSHADNYDYALYLSEIEYATGRFETAISRLLQVSTEPLYQEQALLKLASLYAQIERFNNSLEVANRLLRIDRLSDRATYLKAQALINLGRHDAASGQINRLKTFWQDDAEALTKLAKLQVKIKDYEGANSSFEKALTVAPDAAGVWIEKTKFELFSGQYGLAAKSIAKLSTAKQAPSYVVETLKGDLSKATSQQAQAFEHYQNALKQNGAYVPAFMKLSSLGKSKSLSSEYVAFAERLIESTSNPLYRNTLAEHLMLYQDYERAKFHYQTLLTSKIPKQTAGFAFNNLAMIGIYQSNYAVAAKSAEQALALIDDVPAIFDTAGWAHTLKGDYDKGLYYLRQAYAMNASSTEVLYHLAYTLVKMDRLKEANGYLKQLEQFDSYPELEKVKALKRGI